MEKGLFSTYFFRTFAIANELQWRPSAAAQQRPSKLASAFALHDRCSVESEARRKWETTAAEVSNNHHLTPITQHPKQ